MEMVISRFITLSCIFAISGRCHLLVAGDIVSNENKLFPTRDHAIESNSLINVHFPTNRLKMDMDNTSLIEYQIHVNKSLISNINKQDSIDKILLIMKPITVSPQIKNLELIISNNTVDLHQIYIPWSDLNTSNSFTHTSKITLRATYIGHATIGFEAYLLHESGRNESIIIHESQSNQLKITISKKEGLLDKIFMYSVIIFITTSYVNLGAQIDTANMRKLIEAPRIIFLGFLIGSSVMPIASWLAGQIFFEKHPMFRIGSFIYASGPAASASVLWTVMFDADKELALGLQIASTLGALITMPIFLFALDKSIDLEGQYTIKVPYANLLRTLVSLLIALLAGSYLIGRNKRAKQISQRIFRPLTMFVLLFIVTFSSIVYWYVYRMFDLNITVMAIIVTSATYLLSGLLGYLLNRDINQMVTISISSTYRNSGVAFAALVVAFQQPDIMIAYVPCLTQVVTTSLIGLVLYLLKSLKNHCGNEKELTIT